MDLMGILGGVLQQVEGGEAPAGLPQHMDNAASMIPQGALGDVLSHIFNSASTPDAASSNGTQPFSQMIGGLFGQSSAGTQASVLNGLISAAGPALLGSIMSGGALSGLAGVLGGNTPRALTPDEAAQVPPEEVEKLAHHVQQQNPGIMDEMSQIYAAHPTLIKTLGTGAMMLAMRKISQMQQQG